MKGIYCAVLADFKAAAFLRVFTTIGDLNGVVLW